MASSKTFPSVSPCASATPSYGECCPWLTHDGWVPWKLAWRTLWWILPCCTSKEDCCGVTAEAFGCLLGNWYELGVYKRCSHWSNIRVFAVVPVSFGSSSTEYATFGFSFSILVFFSRKVWTSLSVSDKDFLVFSHHNLRKLRQTTCTENCKGFDVHSSTWPSGAKGEWRVSSWLAVSTHVKKYDIVVTAFLRAGNP